MKKGKSVVGWFVAALFFGAYTFTAIDDSRKVKALSQQVAELNSTVEELRFNLEQQSLEPGVRYDGSTLIVTYGQFEKWPLQFVVDIKTGKAEVRLVAKQYEYGFQTNDKVLSFLKSEVERFASAETPVQLGKTGMSFKFNGGVPVWAPYHTTSNVGFHQYKVVYFAGGAVVEGDQILARGANTQQGYSPLKIVKSL